MPRAPRSVARRVAAVALAAAAGGGAAVVGIGAGAGGHDDVVPAPAVAATTSATPAGAAPTTPSGGPGRVGLDPPLVVWTRGGGVRAPHPTDPAAAVDLLLARAALTLRVVGLLDAVAPFPWRTAVGTLAIGCRPVAALDCPGGVVDRGDRLTVSPAADRWSDATLTYVLRHELAHVWQHATGDLAARRRDLDGVTLAVEVDPLEAAADCLAAAWGSPARGNGYLTCPPDGVARMAAVFAATPAGTVAPPGAGAPQATPASRPDRAAGTTPSSTARTAASVRPSTPSFR